ncbi:mannose-6-phosphate isomerase, class I [Corynebacterium pyruviciproducens]|uniref:mannose-6-phosphate isomerase, class I n=1 Tax=Corynebacterium pyruviciproducens TaxID=598660 RepID=UPI00254A29D5|nr:mannose-6-phosphate isomerase, class I [Corynebacterium pyruviciproducens]MDK7213375.1 mannose-6-phosphate isomerase, class I [Corynebacterium pyruviciproducens]
MKKLTGALRTYPWGSHTLLADLRGTTSPSPAPEAELWFGAHPASPSLIGSTELTDIIADDPVGQVGKSQGELPFLVKILAAGEPLSLQAHPTKEQAEKGFEQENEEGIDLSAPERNYRDRNHKPELLIALTEFTALAGFRPLEKTAELFGAFSCPTLDRYRLMVDSEDEGEGLRALLTTWVSIPRQARETLIDELVATIAAYQGRSEETEPWIFEVGTQILALQERYPYDVGVLVALLLNFVRLTPGEALYLDAGQLHSYLGGLAIEVQANSDNVLRGGLTSKHVDVPELVRVLSFTSLEDPRVHADAHGLYRVPVSEFAVRRVAGPTLSIGGGNPQIVVCTKGTITAPDGVTLSAGEAGWIAASDAEQEVSIDGEAIFVE